MNLCGVKPVVVGVAVDAAAVAVVAAEAAASSVVVKMVAAAREQILGQVYYLYNMIKTFNSFF